LVDSRAKGAKAESDVAKVLKTHTGHDFLRVPLSGALDAKHGLKGDLYLLGNACKFCIEIKHYKDDHLTSKVLTDKNPQLIEWWKQTIREAKEIKKAPLLIFKFDRSKLFVAYDKQPESIIDFITVCVDEHLFYISELLEWLKEEKPKFV
jgi:Holliday junction resolvase